MQKIEASAIEDFYGLTSDIQKSSETGYILFYQSRDCASSWAETKTLKSFNERKRSSIKETYLPATRKTSTQTHRRAVFFFIYTYTYIYLFPIYVNCYSVSKHSHTQTHTRVVSNNHTHTQTEKQQQIIVICRC